jgi:putative transposase
VNNKLYLTRDGFSRNSPNRLEIIVYDKESYQQRNKVEPLFNKIKQFRRVATRYEKLKANFLAFVTVALIVIMLR